jgi:hypothetical protein
MDLRIETEQIVTATEDGGVYAAPELVELGSAMAVTLGSKGNDSADDTQYWN